MKIVKIGSLACTSCIIMDSVFNKIRNDYNFIYEEYDYDLDEDKIKKYDLGKTLPIYIIFNNDCEVGRIIGEKKEKDFKAELERYFNE